MTVKSLKYLRHFSANGKVTMKEISTKSGDYTIVATPEVMSAFEDSLFGGFVEDLTK